MMRDLQLINKYNLSPGDKVIVPKSNWKIIQHHALYLGYDDFGNHYMCENIIGVGVKLTKVQDFFHNVTVTRIERFTGNNYTRKIVVQRALSKLGKPYNLINYNCESFVNDAWTAKPKSNQVLNALGLLALAFFIGLATNDRKRNT